MRLFGRKGKQEEKKQPRDEDVKTAALGKKAEAVKEKPPEPEKKRRGFSLFHRKKKEKPKTAESPPEKKDEVKKTGPAPGKAELKEKSGKKAEKKKKKLPLPRIKVFPRFYEDWVKRQLYFSGSERSPGRLIWTMAIISIIIAAPAALLYGSYMLWIFLGLFFAVFGVMNAMLLLSVDRRGRFVDEILPDALLLLSANIRSGYIPSRALILSARKEFGPLSMAIRRAGKEIMTGASLEEGMREIPKRIRSQDLSRTIKLIIEGVRGGGQIVTLLEENAIDIRRRQAIRKEIKANIMMYAIFIAFAGCLGAPGLYALSGYLTTTTSQLTPDISMNTELTSKVSFIQMGGMQISEEFLFNFSIAAILITTVFGGLILGLINSGKEKDGLKYAPILAILGLVVFFGATFLVNTMFSSIIPV
jgi:flagellar protein FlaJ